MHLHEKMPDLEMIETWINRPFTTTEKQRSKPVLIHFWSLSCPICKTQLPKINQLKEQYQSDLLIIGVHMPRLEADKDIHEVKTVVREYGLHYPVAIDDTKQLTHAFRNQSVPSYYIFDENGFLRYYQEGASTMRLMEGRIHRMIQKQRR